MCVWSHFFSSTFLWVPGIELRLSGWHRECHYWLSHLVGIWFALFMPQGDGALDSLYRQGHDGNWTSNWCIQGFTRHQHTKLNSVSFILGQTQKVFCFCFFKFSFLANPSTLLTTKKNLYICHDTLGSETNKI